MKQTKIDWCDCTLNPVKGCPNGCKYCYARKLNDRFHFVKDWNKPEFFPEVLEQLKSKKTISKDLNQKWVKDVFAGIQKDQIPEDVAQLKAIIDGGHAKSWFIRICINKFLNRKKNCIRRKNG